LHAAVKRRLFKSFARLLFSHDFFYIMYHFLMVMSKGGEGFIKILGYFGFIYIGVRFKGFLCELAIQKQKDI